MTFRVTTGVAAPAKNIVMQVQENLGARGFRPRIVHTCVVHHEVAALRLGAASFVRLLHEPVERCVANGRKHQHRVAKYQLRVKDRP